MAATVATKNTDARLTGHMLPLDGVRGLAIIAVTLYRFNIGPAIDSSPARWFFQLLEHGDLGVDLFFVLSGFLITGILYDAKPEANYFRNFYARRALRIFPLYYGFLFATLVLLPALMGSRDALFAEARAEQSWLWLYAANFLMGLRDAWCLGSFSHFWSLAIEEHFYLLWPLVVFYCTRRQAMVASVLAILISIIGRIVWIRLGGGGVAMETFTFFRLDGLGFGALLALAARGPDGVRPVIKWCAIIGPLCAMAMGYVATLPNRRLMGLPIALAAGFFGSLLVSAVASRETTVWGRFWRSPLLRFFGKYSYAMYVFQWPLIEIMQPWLSTERLAAALDSNILGRLAYITAMFALTTIAAVLSWNLFEKHFMRLKHRFVGRAAKTGA